MYRITTINKVCLTLFLLVVLNGCQKTENVTIIERPPTSSRNSHYVSNRAPLQPAMFIKLPVGSIRPEGWLREYLIRQRDGLTGHLGEISAWLQKENNAWLAADGLGEWGWEEVPYWLKGFAQIGYILNDQNMIDEAEIWLEAVIRNQRDDGNFGPVRRFEDGSIDFWGNMIMLYCLQSWYEFSGDQRVIELMTRYFRFQLSVPDDQFLTHYWQHIRGGDNLHSVFWLYNRTGEPFLLELAEKIHRNTADWTSRGHSLNDIKSWKEIRPGLDWPQWYGDLIDWHNVNHAQGFREPAQYYLLSHDEKQLRAAYENFRIMREHFGQVPGGMFGADEDARPGYDDPRQAIETCGIVEQMNSDEHMLRISGDPFWADHAEEVAFNTYPAATMPDFRALHYLTAPNMVVCDSRSHRPGIQNGGPFLIMNPFSSRCCQHNHSQGWPYFAENLWMATQDNGVAAVIYSAGTVHVKVAEGREIAIRELTNYPYEEQLRFVISTQNEITFPLYLRIPSWCENARLFVNGKTVSAAIPAARYVRLERDWADGDSIRLQLPMSVSVKRWPANHNSASVNYGPLTFSLKIKENYIRRESNQTAIHDSKWQAGADVRKWPSFEIHPASAWNYGLVIGSQKPERRFKLVRRPWPASNFPFTHNENPLSLITTGARLPDWKLDEYGLCGELMDSPVMLRDARTEAIELIPMGAARLRISAFPVVAIE